MRPWETRGRGGGDGDDSLRDSVVDPFALQQSVVLASWRPRAWYVRHRPFGSEESSLWRFSPTPFITVHNRIAGNNHGQGEWASHERIVKFKFDESSRHQTVEDRGSMKLSCYIRRTIRRQVITFNAAALSSVDVQPTAAEVPEKKSQTTTHRRIQQPLPLSGQGVYGGYDDHALR